MGEPDSMTLADDETTDRRRWPAGKVAALAAVALIGVAWILLIGAEAGLPIPGAQQGNPDRLEDRAFAVAAEARCASGRVRIDSLPTARDAESPQDRAEQVEAGTLEVEAMVLDLRNLALDVELQSERDVLQKWFADWDYYIGDRWAHVERLETADVETPGRELAFVLRSDLLGSGIYTERLDGFARVNDMESCLIPGDV